MGNQPPQPPPPKNRHDDDDSSRFDDRNDDVGRIQARLAKKYNKLVPLEVQVAHYTPSIFPLVPIINPGINRICTESWKIICAKKEMTESGMELNGITLFYNDFYQRLDEVDENKKIEAVLSAHSTGVNKIAEKGAIIVRIVQYVLSLKQNDEPTQFRLYALGKAHAKRDIRPYMYSIFVQCLLYTISNQLGLHASHEVMEAWVNMFSFIMKSMLPLAIIGQVIFSFPYFSSNIIFSSATYSSSNNFSIPLFISPFSHLTPIIFSSFVPLFPVNLQ